MARFPGANAASPARIGNNALPQAQIIVRATRSDPARGMEDRKTGRATEGQRG
jgi:hypothetical protein